MKKELAESKLNQVVGGDGGGIRIYKGGTYTTTVSDGYLALRTAANNDKSNEKGALWNGSTVTVIEYPIGKYAYVIVNYAAPGEAGYKKATAGMQGYVEANYLY